MSEQDNLIQRMRQLSLRHVSLALALMKSDELGVVSWFIEKIEAVKAAEQPEQ